MDIFFQKLLYRLKTGSTRHSDLNVSLERTALILKEVRDKIDL